MSQKLCLSLADAAEALNIGKSHLRKYVDRGEIPSFKLGQRRLINCEALDEFRLRLEEKHTIGVRGGS